MRRYLWLFVLLWVAASASAQNFATVNASHIYGGGSVPLAGGTITFQAVDAQDNPISYQVGGGGQQITFPTTCTVVNGVITGTCPVANTALTNPLNVCFDVKVRNQFNQMVLGGPGSGYQCVQPATTNTWCTAAVCNFDAFVPNSSGLPTALLAPPTAITLGGIYAKNCSSTPSTPVMQGVDTNGNPICVAGSGGLGDPGANGPVFRSALNLSRPAVGTDIGAIFSGCSVGAPVLAYDGTCKSIANGITQIIAGTGLSGGGSTGAVTLNLQNPIASNTSGNAATASALAGTPTRCTTGMAPTGIDSAGNALGCAAISGYTAPTGSGFAHITGGAQDVAARAVNLATADVAGTLPATNVGSGYLYTNLVGVPTALPPNGAAGGGLSGNYPNPTVNPANLAASGQGGVTGTLPAAQVGAGYPYSSLNSPPTSLPPSGTAGGGLAGSYPNPTVNPANLASSGQGGVTGLLPYAQLSGAPAALPPNGTASGDLSGTYPGPSVAQVNGLPLPLSAALVGTNGSRQLVTNTGTINNNTNGTASGFTGPLTGDVTGNQAATVVSKVNGGVVPVSAGVVGTNGSGQIVAQAGTIANNTSGNAATATQLAATPTPCSSGQSPTGIDAHGNSINCGTAGVALPLPFGTSYMTFTIPNDTVTGTTNGLLISLNSLGRAIITPHNSASQVLGIAVSGGGISGSVTYTPIGNFPLPLDGPATLGDYACISSTVDGQGTDCTANPLTGQTLGQIQALVSGTTYNLFVNIGVPNPASVAANVVINNPNAAQVIQSVNSTTPPLGIRCPSGAASTLAGFYVLDPSGNSLLKITCGGQLTVGTGVGAVSAGAVYGGWCTVAYAQSLTLDATTCKGFVVTLTGDVTSVNITGIPSNIYMDEIVIRFIQDATGGRIVSGWSNAFKGVIPRSVGRAASTSSTLEFKTDGVVARYQKGTVNEL